MMFLETSVEKSVHKCCDTGTWFWCQVLMKLAVMYFIVSNRFEAGSFRFHWIRVGLSPRISQVFRRKFWRRSFELVRTKFWQLSRQWIQSQSYFREVCYSVYEEQNCRMIHHFQVWYNNLLGCRTFVYRCAYVCYVCAKDLIPKLEVLYLKDLLLWSAFWRKKLKITQFFSQKLENQLALTRKIKNYLFRFYYYNTHCFFKVSHIFWFYTIQHKFNEIFFKCNKLETHI